MPNIRLTRHAKNRMRWRKITNEEIEATIESPDSVNEAGGVKTAFKTIGDRIIKISYIEENEIQIVLTVMFRKLKGDEAR